MLKKLVGLLTVLSILSGQVFAKQKQVEIDIKLNEIVSSISNGMDKDEILSETKSFVDDAKSQNVSLEELLMKLSILLDLDLTEEEIKETVEEITSDYSILDSDKQLDEVAESLAEQGEGKRLIFMSILLLLILMFQFP